MTQLVDVPRTSWLRQSLFAVAVVTVAAGAGGACKKTVTTSVSVGSGSAGTANPVATGRATGSAAPIPVGPSAAYLVAPLGAADRIEPPSRDIVPGMTIAAARAKGAKGADTDDVLTWRPDTSIGIDAATGLTTELQVEYEPAAWDTVKKGWGAPVFDDDTWIGANWMATLDGCANGPCGVTFVRSPKALLGKAVAPPGTFANLRPGMMMAQVRDTCGLAFVDGSAAIGYGLVPEVYYDDDRFEAISFDVSDGDDAYWKSYFTSLWGTPKDLAGDLTWVDPAGIWLAGFEVYGDTVRFVPHTPLAAYLAKTGVHSVLANAVSVVGKPKAALATLPGWNVVDNEAYGSATEYSFDRVRMAVDTDAADAVVTAFKVTMPVANNDDLAAVRKQLAALLGPIVVGKNADDEEVATITAGDLKITVEDDGSSIELRLGK